MADQTESAGEKPTPPGQEERVGKRVKKPKFNMPFIVSGILVGIFAGAPLLDLGNYVFELWGWIFGILAVYLFSRQFKYFNAAHAGIIGLFAGIIGSVISVTTHILLSVADFSLDKILPANFIAQISKFTAFFSSLWIPEQLRWIFSLKPLSLIQKEFEDAIRAADPNACSPTKCLIGHVLLLAGLISITTIIGALVGYYLFARPVPEKVKDMKYARYARRPPVRRGGEGGAHRQQEKPPQEPGAQEKNKEETEEEGTG
jgi:hypothetical protein